MGLDMYLCKRLDVSFNYHAAYWRKANQIHNWFVINTQNGKDDCKEYNVSVEQLKDLVDICKQIKEQCPLVDGEITNGQRIVNGKWEDIKEQGKLMTNIEFAENLLPCTEGCFFGSKDYDEYYIASIDETIEQLTKLLDDPDVNKYEYTYQSSW